MLFLFKSLLFPIGCSFLLVFLLSVSNTQGADLCDIYSENWTCPDLMQVVPRNDRTDFDTECQLDMVQTTLKLLEDGDKEIELSENVEAVLVIGRTGTGKSTLTYFLAGDTTQMISFKAGQGRYNIKDCQGKIGNSTIVSATIFPDLVVENITNTAFYDNPGFADTRSACIEIANAYFMKKVADHIKRVKFVLVSNYESIAAAGSRTDFPDMLRSVMNFIPNVAKFEPAFGLIGTKLRIVEEVGETMDAFLEDAVNFMKRIQPDLPFKGEELTKANAIVDAIANISRVGVFRMPKGCGPLSDRPEMQENRDLLHHVIMDNLQYVDSTPSDFGVTISGESQLKVLELVGKLSQDSIAALNTILTSFYEFTAAQLQCIETDMNCGPIAETLGQLFSNSDFLAGYSNEGEMSQLNYTALLERLMSADLFSRDFVIPPQLDATLIKNSRYLDFLSDLGDYPRVLANWLQPFKDLHRKVNTQIITFVPKLSNATFQALSELSWNLRNSTLTEVKRLPNIVDRQTVLDANSSNIAAKKLEIEADLAKKINLSAFINKTVACFQSTKIPLQTELVTVIDKQSSLLHQVENLGFSTTIGAEPENKYWMDPIEAIESLVRNEATWNLFLQNLFKDLAAPNVQADGELGLKSWWASNSGGISSNTSSGRAVASWDAFWTKFKDVPALENVNRVEIETSLSVDRIDKIDVLNSLLRTTLAAVDCQVSGGTTTIRANFVSMKDVIKCVNKETTRTLLIYSFNTIYLDAILTGAGTSSAHNLDVLIISPKWWTGAGISINLNGRDESEPSEIPGQGNQDGRPGLPGGKAGNLVSVGETFSGQFPQASVRGGHGGAGQAGQHGKNGVRGFDHQAGYYRCEAKSGAVKVDPVPGFTVTCCDNSVPSTSGRWCHAGDKGCLHSLYGTSGGDGGNGGNGGKGAAGGFGGSTSMVTVAFGRSPVKNTLRGEPGEKGSDGKGGPGGSGGKRGDTFNHHYDDFLKRENGSALRKNCGSHNSGWYSSDDRWASEGSPGTAGGNSESPASPTPQKFDPKTFKSHITAFKTEANGKKGNLFIGGYISDFVSKVNENEIV